MEPTDFELAVERGVHDPDRLAAVRATGLLDTRAEDPFESMATLVAELLGTPLAFVTVVDDERAYWKACIGIGGPDPADRQHPVSESFCQYAIALDGPLFVADARVDPRTSANVSVTTKGLVAWAGHPIRDREGRILGSCCVVDMVPRDWSERDARILQMFADAISSEIDLRSTVAATQQLSDATLRLATVARAMSAATSTDEIRALIVEQGPAIVGAEFANLGLVDDDLRVIMVDMPRGLDPSVTQRFRSLSIDAHTPMADAIRTAAPVFVPDSAARALHYPDLVDSTDAAGLVTTLSVPLRRADGTVLGALGLGWKTARTATEAEQGVLDTFISLCAQTLERSMTADVRVDLITQMQQHLLPATPAVPLLDVAVRYLPANDVLGLGGDWYDVIPIDEHRTLLVIGDVVGHGVEAAARMAQVQGVLQSLIWLGTPLPDMFPAVERALAHLEQGYLATIGVSIVDTGAGTLSHVSAGHPPPILWTPGAGARTLDRGRRRLIGHPAAPAAVAETVDFPVGSIVLSYTDGLIERRGEAIDDSIQRLVEFVSVLHEAHPEGVADAILASRFASAGTTRRDDTAMTIVRRR